MLKKPSLGSQQQNCKGMPIWTWYGTIQVSRSKARYPFVNNNNNNRRPLIPKSTGAEDAKLKT